MVKVLKALAFDCNPRVGIFAQGIAWGAVLICALAVVVTGIVLHPSSEHVVACFAFLGSVLNLKLAY